jgi:serine protease Do
MEQWSVATKVCVAGATSWVGKPLSIEIDRAADLMLVGAVSRSHAGKLLSGIDGMPSLDLKVSNSVADALGLSKAQGVLVGSLVKGGAGEEAGVKEKDVILSVDGKEVNAANELQSYVATRHPGDVVTLKIFREGKTIEKRVTLRARDEETSTVKASDKRERDADAEQEAPKVTSFESLGMSVRSLTPEEKEKQSVDGGALVTDVKPFGEAANRNIGRNAIILEADRKEVGSAADLKKIIESHKPGDSILLRLKFSNGVTNYAAVQLPKE